MFNYTELAKTGTFYIEFNTRNKLVGFSGYDVEDLVRYWYRTWFDKLTNPVIKWINYDAVKTNDVVEVQVNLKDCKSKHYAEKDFIDKAEYVIGDNRNSLRRILTYGVNNAKTKLPKVDCDFVITNTYNIKLDIPNPYLVKDFSIKTKLVSINELENLVNTLIEQEDSILNKLSDELDTNTKYKLMRQQLDKIEKLGKILELTTDLY